MANSAQWSRPSTLLLPCKASWQTHPTDLTGTNLERCAWGTVRQAAFLAWHTGLAGGKGLVMTEKITSVGLNAEGRR